MEELARVLLMWIATRTDYDTATMPLPEIAITTRADLTDEFLQGASHPGLDPDWVAARLAGLYIPGRGPDGTIVILDPEIAFDAEHWDDPLENPYFREILLHELVHHAQWQSGAPETWSCDLDGEREAFRLGGLYLRERKVDDPMTHRGFWASPFTAC